MANKSSIERNKKRTTLAHKYEHRRESLKQQLYQASVKDKWNISAKLQRLPRNSAPTRIYRRCFLTGRPRAVYRDFGLSRHVLREMAHACLLPGMVKASW